MRLLFNATNLRSEGGVILLIHLLQGFLSLYDAMELLLYLNPELSQRLETVRQTLPVSLQSRLMIFPFRSRNGIQRFLWEQWSLPRLIQTHRIDCLFSFGNTGPRFPGCQQILYVQQSIPYSDYVPPRHRGRWFLFKMLYRTLMGLAQEGSDRIIVPTQWLVAPMWKSIGFRKPLTTYHVSPPGLPVGVEDARFNGVSTLYAPHEQALLENLECWRASDEKILVYPCYMAPYKNIPYLLEAIRHLLQHAEPPAFRLLLTFQQNSREYFPCWAEIEKQLATLPSERVILTGTLSRAAMAAVYCRSDVVVFPSLVETLGLPLLEAMAHGLPSVALHAESSDALQAAFALELCGNAALYASPAQPEHFAQQVLSLLQDNALWLQMSQQAKARSQRFQWEQHIQEILGIAPESASSVS